MRKSYSLFPTTPSSPRANGTVHLLNSLVYNQACLGTAGLMIREGIASIQLIKLSVLDPIHVPSHPLSQMPATGH